jgi:hypothetical protein
VEATDNTPRSLEDFAESLLMPSPNEAEQDDEPQAPDEDQTEGEEAQADEDTEASDADESDEEPDDDDAKDEGRKQPQLLKVKVDGKDVEVTIDDLKRSYSGQAYIQQRMQEVAAEKKQAEAVYMALAEDRAKVVQFLQQIQQGGIPQPPKMPSQELAQKDPIKYNAELGRYVQEREQYDQFVAQTQALTVQQSEAQQRAMQAHLAYQAELLKQAIPEFADPDKGGTLRQRLVQVGTEYGFSPEELSSVTDFRTVQVLNDARKWRELQAQKGETAKRVEKARPVVKPGAKPMNSKNTRREEQQKRLKQTGRIDDAIDLFFQ